MTNIKYISVYVRNQEEGPSDYYRLVQYLNILKLYSFKINDAISINELRTNMKFNNNLYKKLYQCFLYFKILYRRTKQLSYDIIHKPAVIIVERELIPRYLPAYLKKIYISVISKSFLIWDFDDDLICVKEISCSEWNLLNNNSRITLATSNYLLSMLNSKCVAKRIQLPTTDSFASSLNLEFYQKNREDEFQNAIRLVWVGTSSNIQNVYSIIPQLEDAAKSIKDIGKQLILHFVCNISLKINKLKYLQISSEIWNRKVAERAILLSHIGLMPIPNNKFSLGKGGFKLIQYMSTGIPVIASNIGFNKEIVDSCCGFLVEEQWTDSIVKLSLDFDLWKSMGEMALKKYNEKFNYKHNANIWKKIIEEAMRTAGKHEYK